jgi:hypothetical protein
MKVEINEKGKTKEREFPKLMKSERLGQIILAYGINEDTGHLMGVLLKDNGYPIGECYSITWDEKPFQDFDGSITLSND